MKIKKTAIIAVLIGAGLLMTGAKYFSTPTDAVLVEEVHIVQKGETVWSIAEEYLPKNTATRRYILEYIQGIYENNPQVKENRNIIHAGDKLIMTYWINKEEVPAE